MRIIFYETEHFVVQAPQNPLVSRDEGGHVHIAVKEESVTDRTKLRAKQAIELMRLTIIVGRAMEKVMNERGVPVAKINYQDMGNWAYKKGKTPYLHVHVFGRVFDAPHQPLPESVYLPDRSSGFYDSFEPLQRDDIEALSKEIDSLFAQEEYSDKMWGM